ncbi:MAG: helix-turn-helix transcriptional regulator [Clostridia bacterium]|nr:helix-turn-helix transcriptional regulator [Clostridia bacterium]
MKNLAKVIGGRIRSYRTKLGLSQEKLAELAGCHPTYIGQLERGEKNATLESIDRIASSLNLPLSKLFENLGGASSASEENFPLACYELILTKNPEEQEQIFKILLELDKYKSN